MIHKSSYIFCFIRGLLNRVKMLAIVQNWFTEPARVRCTVFCSSLYFFTLLIWRSTWILKLAIFWLSSIWDGVNCPSVHKKWGVAIVIPVPSKSLFRTNPLSAMIWSPGSKSSRSPHNFQHKTWIECRNKSNSSIGCYSHKNSPSTVIFVRRKCFRTECQWRGLFGENFGTIYYYSGFRIKSLKILRHVFQYCFSVGPNVYTAEQEV